MTKPTIKISRIRYFDVVRHWPLLRSHYYSDESSAIWKPNMRDWNEQKAAEHKFPYKYAASRYTTPSDHDGCDWRCGRRGRSPEFWLFVCHAACHFLVDMNLLVAMSAFPKVPWRIVTQRHHSTIWNGDTENPVLFDPQFLALEVMARQAWQIASRGRFLKPGNALRPFVFAKDYFK